MSGWYFIEYISYYKHHPFLIIKTFVNFISTSSIKEAIFISIVFTIQKSLPPYDKYLFNIPYVTTTMTILESIRPYLICCSRIAH